jgi:hypothetical protein
MKVIEIELPMDSAFEVFETNTISVGMTKNAPGGAAIRLQQMPTQMRKRHLTHDAASLVSLAVTFESDVSVGLFVTWLASKLMKSKLPYIRISKRAVEEITPDSLERIIEETTEIED